MLDGDGQRRASHYVTAALRPKEGYDVREEVARTVIQNGWPLREIRLEHATLEEFFVQVTANQAVGHGRRTRGSRAVKGVPMSRAPSSPAAS